MSAKRARRDCDALVVGAGPAGAAAALHLARSGAKVVLVDRASFPRRKPCGDALMPGAVRWLRRANVAEVVAPGRSFAGVRMEIARRATHEYRFGADLEPGVTIPRTEFDHRLVQAAVAAGARLVEHASVIGPLLDGRRVIGARMRRAGGAQFELRAPWTIAADGSRSRLARMLHLASSDNRCRGVAVRAYFSGVRDLRDALEVMLPLERAGGATHAAGYGWVFPMAGGLANIGIGVMAADEAAAGYSLRRLFEDFVANLRADERFRSMVQTGGIEGAPLDCGFDARRVATDGLLLAGDAAGLVDAYTGEGIQWALESGEAAARVVAHEAATSEAAIERYRGLLRACFDERARFGRQMLASRRFAWRLLDRTCGSHTPLAGQFRRAMLDFGLAATSADGDALAAQRPGTHALAAARQFMAQVDRAIEDALGRDFPFIVRIVRAWLADPGRQPRLLAYRDAARLGGADLAAQVRGAVGVELAYLGYQAFTNVSHRVRSAQVCTDEGPRVAATTPCAERWSDTLAVLVGDCLLARANRTAAGLGSDIATLFAQAGTEICRFEADEAALRAAADSPATDSGAQLDARTQRILAALAVRVACRLGQVAPGPARVLEDYATLLADDPGAPDVQQRIECLRDRTSLIPVAEVRIRIESWLDERVRPAAREAQHAE